MQFNGFTKKTIEFLKDLKNNNTKVWFEDHRYIWENEIRKPTEAFVCEMGETLQIIDPNINFEPKVGKSLFKIYADVRFRKDKTPIKSKIGMIFYKGNTHRMQSSSFYLHFDKDQYFIATGIRNFKPELLATYREYIKNETKRVQLHHILEDIKSKGYNIVEPKYKRLPKGFDKDDKYIYLALYSAMYGYQTFDIDDAFFSFDLATRSFQIYDDMKELYFWLYNMTISAKK